MKKCLELSDIFHEPSLEERLLGLAQRVRAVRKRRRLSQKDLADRSFVSYGSIKRFEQTGQASLEALFRIADALGLSAELDGLFAHVPPTYEEVIHG